MKNWYAHDSAAFLEGTACMSLELKGAYITLLDTMYLLNTCELHSDEKYIAGLLCVSTRKARSLVNDLVSRGKFERFDGKLRQVRVKFELENRANLSRTRAECGAKGGAASNKNKRLSQANASPTDITDITDKVYTSEFEKFWSIYPRRIGKGTAFKAWARAKRRASLDSIIAGAERLQVEFDRKGDLTYCPHPTTWLNRDGWLDERPKRAVIPQALREMGF